MTSFRDQTVAARSDLPDRSLWGRRALIALVLAGGAYLAFVAVASRALDPVRVADLLEPRLERIVGRDVEISSAKVGFFPLAMKLQGITVSDPTGSASVLAQVESLEFQVKLLPLLRREVRVGRVLVQSPVAHLRVSADGTSNFGDLSSEAPASDPTPDPETQASLSLDFQSIRVLDGALSFVNEGDSTAREVRDLSLQAKVEHGAQGPWIFLGTMEGDVVFGTTGAGSSPPGQPLPVELAFDLQASSDFRELEIRAGQLTVDPVSLALTGRVGGLQDPVRKLSLRLEGQGIPLRQLWDALPPAVRDSLPVRGDGTVSLALSTQGDLGAGIRPDLSGTVTLAGGTLTGEGNVRLAQYLDVNLTVLPQGMLGVDARGEFMNGPFSLVGTVGMRDRRELDLQVEAYPELSLARRLGDFPEGTELDGRVRANVRVTGSAKEIGSLRFWGEAAPSEVHLTTEALPVPLAIHGGAFTLRGTDATFRDLSFSLGRDEFRADGALGNLSALVVPGEKLELRGDARGSRLDLTTLTTATPPDPALTYGKVAFARLGNRVVAGRTVEDAARELRLNRPDSLPLAGEMTLALDTLINARGRMENVRARVAFGPDFIRVTDATFRRYGGTLQTNLDLRLGGNPNEAFSFTLNADGLEAPAFLSATSPLGSLLRGRLSLQMEMVGTLDSLLLPNLSSLVGSGSFSVREGGMNSTVVTESLANFLSMEEYRAPGFRDWSSSFLLQDGRVQLAEGTLGGAPGEPRFGGSIGMDGGLDLLSVFSLPTARLSSYAQRNLGVAGEVAGRVANRPEVVRAVIRIGGSVLSPDLVVDPGAAMADIRGAVQEEVQAEAQRVIQEQRTNLQNRASSFLRGMVQRPTAGPPDPTRPDTIRPDTLRPDTIRPDTLRPDTLRPDTIRPDTLPPDTIPPDTARIR